MEPKFVYTGGKYREFRGYVFANGNPVVIKDRATTEALRLAHDFKEIRDEPQEAQAAPQILTEPAANGCPKCGKALPSRGAHFHIRACRG